MVLTGSVAPIIDAQGLGQAYGRHVVLSDLTLAVEPGITVLLGPNGSGKTTLLETLATLRPPLRGRLSVLGLDAALDARAIRRATGFLPQTFGFFGNFTVREYVEYSAWLKCVPDDMIEKRVALALSRVGLRDDSHVRMKKLSGGMLRRAGIAQAIVHKPPLIILDEPSAGLDPGQRIALRQLIQKMSPGTSFLVSTHLVDDLRSLADRVVVLSAGQAVFDGTITELENRGADSDAGDTPLERGYSSVLGLA